MKLTFRQIEPFLNRPDPKARVILIYGPDDGLMRARTKSLGKKIVDDLNDPFNVSTLRGDEVSSDPARLMDEANAISMMGGDRLVRIEEAKDGLTPALKTYLENPSQQTLVIIEAGDLGPRSPLRLLCEKSKQAAALPCYIADARNLSTTIRNTMSEDRFTATSDAILWLSENLAGDHGRVMSELNKLKIYMGNAKHIDLHHAQAACGSGGTMAIDDFVYALAGKHPEAMLKALKQLNEEGIPTITLIRSLQNHLRRLHITQSRMKGGQSLDAAMGKLMPKIFFKLDQPFKSQLQKWSMLTLSIALERLSDLEARTKQTGTPIETLSAQAFLSLARGR